MPLISPKNKSIAELRKELTGLSKKMTFYGEIVKEIQRDAEDQRRHNMGVAYITPDRKIIYANNKLSELLGVPTQEFIGRDVDMFIYTHRSFPDWNQTLIPLLTGNDLDMTRGKHILKTIDEQPVFFDILYFAYRDKYNNLEFIKGIFQDVTQAVQATEKLVSERQKTENILHSGSLGYWVYDDSDNRITWSGNYQAIIGYQAEELDTIASKFKLMVHPEDLSNSYFVWEKGRFDEYKAGIEFRIRTKSGKYKWVLSKIVNIEEDAAMNKRIISGIHIDIDGYKRTALKVREKERQIIQNEENLRKIYKSLPIGIVLYNTNGDYMESNEELLHIFGLQSKKEVDKTNLLELNPRIKSFIQHHDYSVDIGYDLKEKQVYEDYTYAPKTPHTRYINIRIISLLDTEGYVHLDNQKQGGEMRWSGNKAEAETGYLLVATDNTILRRSELDLKMNELELKEKNIILSKAKEKAQESDRLKSAFLANVSHEIRTPLNAIIGFSELIASSKDEKEKDVYFEIVKTNNDLLLNLINDILDLSRIESGRIDLKNSPLNIDKVCKDLAETSRLRSKEGVEVIYKYPELAVTKQEGNTFFVREVMLFADKKRITQIYTNLISNALKNTASGTIAIYYKLAEVSEDDKPVRTLSIEDIEKLYTPEQGEICLLKKTNEANRIMIAFSVSDTGIGIPENKQQEIFDRFTKLNDTQSGFGLGLAITRSLAEQMGGFITVKSQMGKGSEFSVFLPFNIPAESIHEKQWCSIGERSLAELRETSGERNAFSPDKEGAALTENNLLIPELSDNSLIENFEKLNIKLPKVNIEEDNYMADQMLDILVAEDIDFNYMLVKAIIGKKHNLFRAKTGLEAVELFNKQKFNLILMDMKMPEMDGITATRLIRQKDTRIPIIAVTAYAFDTDKQIALEAGCNTYIVKPIDPKILISEIEKYALSKPAQESSPGL